MKDLDRRGDRTSAETTRVLAVEDDPDLLLFMVRRLEGLRDGHFKVETAASVGEAIRSIDVAPPDCILLDLTLPDASGIDAIGRVRDHTDAPIVVLTGRSELGVEAMTNGAQDFLTKDGVQADVIAASVHRAIAAHRTHRERDLLAGIVDSTLQAVASLDASGTITSWNQGAVELFGYSASEAIGQPASMIAPADRKHEALDIVTRVLRGESIVGMESVRVRKDGLPVEVAITVGPLNDHDGNLVGSAIVYHDLTERKAAERELARREAQLNEAQRIARLGSFEWDPTTDHLTCSEEMYRVFGRDPLAGGLLWDQVLAAVDEKDRPAFDRAVASMLAGGGSVALEVQIHRPDGSVAPISVTGRATGDHGPHRVVGTAQDVTDRRRLEQQLLQSQKMEALGGLAGGIAHDFNNLLGVIMNYGRFVLEDLPHDSPQRPDVIEIVNAADKGAGLVKQLLAFSRREVIRPQVIDLNVLISEMEPLLSRVIEESMRLETNLAIDLWRTEADHGQLEQVLLNLVVNARDAMQGGGVISIGTGNIEVDETYSVGFPEFTPGPYACITVGDTGAGMNKETQERIFEPFFTTKPRGSGTGLGLSTVYGIVKRTGGFVTVYSEPGLGTVFKVYLPATAKEADQPDIVMPTLFSGRGERILVVEDERAVLDVITRILSSAHYEVVGLTSTDEALNVLERDDRGFKLLLTDVIMPNMSGRALSEKVGLPTIFMSGYTDSIIEEQGILQDGVAFLPKPFSASELLTIVRAVLDECIETELGKRAGAKPRGD